MYSNTQRPTKKDPKTRFYYYCKNTSTATGHKCTFRTNIEQSQIDNFVAAVISAMVHDPKFENAIKDKIGTVVDTSDLVKELDTLKGKLRQALSIKGRLEQQLDTLPYDDPHYDRKILDLQRRYDDQYDIIELLESQIEDIETQIRDIRQEQISGENVYELLRSFDDLYEELDNSDKRDLMRAIIERVELFPERRKDGCWVKSIVFNFPVPVNGRSLKELSLENETTLECVVLLSHSDANARSVRA